MSIENSNVYKKHKNCEVEIVVGPFGPHYAKLVCKSHKKLIQWLNKESADTLIELI
jgi:hypothetical protein